MKRMSRLKGQQYNFRGRVQVALDEDIVREQYPLLKRVRRLVIGRIGTRRDVLIVFKTTAGLTYMTGCFYGTEKQFKRKLEGRARNVRDRFYIGRARRTLEKKSIREYNAAILLAHAHFGIGGS